MESSIVLFLLLACVNAEESATPSSLLRPRNFNHHAFEAKRFLLAPPESTKQGPVLFPNDGPPPPRQPLIVTSRPLLESIARSELGNNSLPESSQLNNVVRPFLARVKEYRPFQYLVATVAPIAFSGHKEDYEERTTLPPIYKVLSDHAKQKVLEIQRQKHKHHHNHIIKEPEYLAHYKNRHVIRHGDHGNDDQYKNYAFSYRVNDKNTGDDFSHTQHSRGSATNGEYRVRLPDGRMQIVSYTADENGYKADVRYADDDKSGGHRLDHSSIPKVAHDNLFNGQHNHISNNDDFILHKPQYNDYSLDPYKEKHDYETKVYKPADGKYKTSNDYYTDLSKEYYNDDFSSEYDSKNYDYAPHRSKFASFINENSDLPHISVPKATFASGSTVTPSYDDLKDLLVTKKAYNTIQPYVTRIPVVINSPSTTPIPIDDTTERVVVIGGKKPNLYTSISNSLPLVSPTPVSVTPLPFKYNTDFAPASTPSNYLISTINNLRNKVDLSGPKPILSRSYIDRINKYITYKK